MAVTNSTGSLNGPITLAAVGDGIDRDLIVGMIAWEGATTAGDDLQLEDFDTAVIYIKSKAAANDLQIWDFTGFSGGGRRFPNGVKASVLDHGEVRLWLA